MILNAIVVDDEPRALIILRTYFLKSDDIQFCGEFLNARSALEFLKEHRVDVLFLDINMPEMDGFSLLRELDPCPAIIFTTAYSEFAVESYEMDAVDYLKKPFSFERFRKAVDKVKKVMRNKSELSDEPKEIQFRIEGKTMRLLFEDIRYFQSLGNYIKIVTHEKTHLSQMTTKELESALPRQSFIRVHKSYIVNRAMIRSVHLDEIIIGDQQIPIGKTFKKYVDDCLRHT